MQPRRPDRRFNRDGDMITAKSNQHLKRIGQLLRKRSAREEEQAFVIEGRKMFFELLRDYPELLQRAFFSESGLAGLSEQERALACSYPYDIVRDDVFASVAETVTPQGVMAIVSMPKRQLSDLTAAGKGILLLETLQDPGNLGTMIRTAEAADMGGILLSHDSVDAFSPKVVRATMGAIFRVPFVYASDFPKAIEMLKEQGYTVFAAHLKGSVPYDEADYGKKHAIMIGNEGNGLTEEAASLADYRVRIPMAGQAESLNAAVAAAILMYEAGKC